MSISNISNTYRLQSSSLKNIANTSMPNWGEIPHKGMKRPSNQEFQAIIEDLGQALAKAKANKDDAEYGALWRKVEEFYLPQYISIVSPDRKALYEEASPYINQIGNKTGIKPHNPPKTLIDFLNEHDAKLKSSNRGRFEIQLASGTNITAIGSDIEPYSFEIRAGFNSEPFIGKSIHGWYYHRTPQEDVKMKEFLSKISIAEKSHSFSFKNEHSTNPVWF